MRKVSSQPILYFTETLLQSYHTMKFNLLSAFVSLSALAVSVSALSCDEANRFGNATVTPTNPKEGDVSNIYRPSSEPH